MLELLDVVVEAPAPKLNADVVVAGLVVVAAEAPKPPKPVLAAGAVVLEDKLNGELVGAALLKNKKNKIINDVGSFFKIKLI